MNVIADYLYLGGYYDLNPHRILGEPNEMGASMTTEECINTCINGSYSHAMTEVNIIYYVLASKC